ncbi:putative non-specific serine/threonine protein kinase [Helianthus anomalus]
MPLLTFTLPLYSLLLFSSTTTAAAQPYNATNYYLFECGYSSTTNFSDRTWDGDESSNFVPSSITTTSFSSAPLYQDPSVPETPYSTARIFNTSSVTPKPMAESSGHGTERNRLSRSFHSNYHTNSVYMIRPIPYPKSITSHYRNHLGKYSCSDNSDLIITSQINKVLFNDSKTRLDKIYRQLSPRLLLRQLFVGGL